MAKDKKQIQTFRLNTLTLDVIRDVVDKGLVKYGGDDSMRSFIELIMSRFLYDSLMSEAELEPMRKLIQSASMNHEALCRFFLKYRRAKRGEKGYKLHRRTEKDGTKHIGKVVWISEPADKK